MHVSHGCGTRPKPGDAPPPGYPPGSSETRSSAYLGIPAGVTQVSLIAVAYTKGLDFKPAKRPPVEEITHWNGW